MIKEIFSDNKYAAKAIDKAYIHKSEEGIVKQQTFFIP